MTNNMTQPTKHNWAKGTSKDEACEFGFHNMITIKEYQKRCKAEKIETAKAIQWAVKEMIIRAIEKEMNKAPKKNSVGLQKALDIIKKIN